MACLHPSLSLAPTGRQRVCRPPHSDPQLAPVPRSVRPRLCSRTPGHIACLLSLRSHRSPVKKALCFSFGQRRNRDAEMSRVGTNSIPERERVFGRRSSIFIHRHPLRDVEQEPCSPPEQTQVSATSRQRSGAVSNLDLGTGGTGPQGSRILHLPFASTRLSGSAPASSQRAGLQESGWAWCYLKCEVLIQLFFLNREKHILFPGLLK